MKTLFANNSRADDIEKAFKIKLTSLAAETLRQSAGKICSYTHGIRWRIGLIRRDGSIERNVSEMRQKSVEAAIKRDDLEAMRMDSLVEFSRKIEGGFGEQSHKLIADMTDLPAIRPTASDGKSIREIDQYMAAIEQIGVSVNKKGDLSFPQMIPNSQRFMAKVFSQLNEDHELKGVFEELCQRKIAEGRQKEQERLSRYRKVDSE